MSENLYKRPYFVKKFKRYSLVSVNVYVQLAANFKLSVNVYVQLAANFKQ